MKKILLVDGFSYIFKSYYAFISRPLMNKDGENTSAIFGFFKSLLSILKYEKPDYYLIALESKKECFRNKIYPEYKANRPPPPEDLKSQIIKIIDLIKLLDIPYLFEDSYEADDVIGTISNRYAKDNDHRVSILSSDKDLRQLINDRVTMSYTDKSSPQIKTLDENEVIKIMGIKPDQVVDFLALTGDSSDNIPGVKGIGPKTAVQLLNEWKNLENIYNNLENISSKNVKTKLIENKKNAFLSKELATIKKDIPIQIILDDWKIKPLNLNNAINLLKNDNLKTLIDAINEYNLNFNKTDLFDEFEFKKNDASYITTENNNTNLKSLSKEYKLIFDLKNIEEKFNTIKNCKEFCFDLETTGFDFINDKIICINIAVKDDVFIIPFHISDPQQKEANITITENYIKNLTKLLKEIFEDNNILKIGHNLKFDIKFLKTIDIEINGNLFDTMLAEYCLDASHNILNMDDLAEKYLSYKTIHYKDVVENPNKETLQDVSLDKLTKYSGEDADITYQLYKVLKDKLKINKKTEELFYNIEIPLLEILIDMEYCGVSIDKEYLKELSTQLETQINSIYNEIIEIAQVEFNPNTPKQLAEILFEKFKLPVIKKTKTGPSTDVEVLNKLSYLHPIAGLLLEYRTLTKIKSTYSDSLPEMLNSKTNKIHTTYLQTGTQTGRLSSKNPNLQNIPVKTEIGRKIRTAFIPSGKCILMSADYSQVELFLLAELSKDQNLCDAFLKGEDIHTRTASIIFNKSIAEVTKDERSTGKTINFSILYGQGPHRLSENLRISRKEASNFISIYFKNYSGVNKYMEEIRDKCKKLGYAETLWGRIRTIREINDKNKNVQANGERMAVNTTIQGTAADLLKVSMIKIWNKFKEKKLKSHIIMQVHDELIFEVLKEEKESVQKIIKDCMENGFDFKLKLKTSIETGKNWGEL